MKDELRRHGLPCARHAVIRTWADAEAFVAARSDCRSCSSRPPAWAASRPGGSSTLDELHGGAALRCTRAPSDPALAEEFLRGREYSFETITIGGEVRFQSRTRYYPAPLEVMETPWIQWVVRAAARHRRPRLRGRPRARRRRREGARPRDRLHAHGVVPPRRRLARDRRDRRAAAGREHRAARTASRTTPTCTARGRAPSSTTRSTGRTSGSTPSACAFLRGVGRGRVVRVHGVERSERARRASWSSRAKLPTPGARKSDSYEGDGYVIVRHPDTEVVKQAMNTIIETIQVEYA